MSVDATACTLRVAREDPAASKAENKPYAQHLKANGIFRFMKAPNCAVVSVEDILRGHIKGFFLLPAGQARQKGILTDLPVGWVEAMRAGRAGLILDYSKEGCRFSGWIQRCHLQLKALDISPSRLVYVTQNRIDRETYNLWCKKNGMEARIAIVNYDYHISWFCRRSWPDPAAALAERIHDFENRNEVDKRFVCLNRKPKPMRIALLTRLIKDNYWDNGFISFGGFELQETTPSGAIIKKFGRREIGEFRALTLAAGSEAYLDALAGKGQVFIGKAKNVTRAKFLVGDDMTDIYRRSAFTLVTETEMRRAADRITEKPLKPLANCHPAILFGNYGALALLKSFGFKTFEPWIDESYDAIEEPEARFLAAYDAFQGFYKMAWDSVREDRELRDVLLYNAEHAMINLPRLYQETLDPKLCREIAAVLDDA